EQRHTIKEFVKDMKADATDVQATVGEPVPPGINPRPMPSDVGQRVPQVKTHRFFLTAQQIVIVDPKDNKVADVIKLAAYGVVPLERLSLLPCHAPRKRGMR